MLAELAASDRHFRHACALNFACGFATALLLVGLYLLVAR